MTNPDPTNTQAQNNITGNQNNVTGAQYNAHGNIYNIYGTSVEASAQLTNIQAVTQHQPGTDRPTVGRQQELTSLASVLTHHPAVAITGVGGIGKTTLATMLYQCAATFGYTYRCWRDLNHNPSFADFVRASLAALGLPFDSRERPNPGDQAEHLRAILHDNRQACLLIILNNFETILNSDTAPPGWSDFLTLVTQRGLGSSRLLLTSRTLPQVAARNPHRFPLSGLTEADALQLLAHSGITNQPNQLTQAIKKAGGHPLALVFLADLIESEGYTLQELLASQIWDKDIATRLLNEIYHKLTPALQQTLGYFSLFTAPTTVTTIAGMLTNLPIPLAGWDEERISELATQLAHRSLLDSRKGQYALHPLIRTYAYNLLGDTASHHRAAASYFQQQYSATHSDAYTHPARNLVDVQPLLDAYDQLIAGRHYSTAYEIITTTPLQYAVSRSWYLYDLLLRWSEFNRLVGMLEPLSKAPAVSLEESNRVKVLRRLGYTYRMLGDYTKAIEYFNLQLKTAESIEDYKGQAIGLSNLGMIYLSLGNSTGAIEYHNRSIAIAQRTGYGRELAIGLDNLGHTFNSLGDHTKAIEFYSRALAIKEQIEDRYMQAISLSNIGLVYDALEEHNMAIEYHSRCFGLAAQIGDQYRQAISLSNMGKSYTTLGDYDQAIKYYLVQLEMTQRINDMSGQSSAWNNLGGVLYKQCHYQEALACYLKAQPLREHIGNLHDIAQNLDNISELRATVGQEAWPAIEAEARLLADDPVWLPQQLKDEDTP